MHCLWVKIVFRRHNSTFTMENKCCRCDLKPHTLPHIKASKMSQMELGMHNSSYSGSVIILMWVGPLSPQANQHFGNHKQILKFMLHGPQAPANCHLKDPIESAWFSHVERRLPASIEPAVRVAEENMFNYMASAIGHMPSATKVTRLILPCSCRLAASNSATSAPFGPAVSRCKIP